MEGRPTSTPRPTNTEKRSSSVSHATQEGEIAKAHLGTPFAWSLTGSEQVVIRCMRSPHVRIWEHLIYRGGVQPRFGRMTQLAELFCAARRGEGTLDRCELRLARYFYPIVLEACLRKKKKKNQIKKKKVSHPTSSNEVEIGSNGSQEGKEGKNRFRDEKWGGITMSTAGAWCERRSRSVFCKSRDVGPLGRDRVSPAVVSFQH